MLPELPRVSLFESNKIGPPPHVSPSTLFFFFHYEALTPSPPQLGRFFCGTFSPFLSDEKTYSLFLSDGPLRLPHGPQRMIGPGFPTAIASAQFLSEPKELIFHFPFLVAKIVFLPLLPSMSHRSRSTPPLFCWDRGPPLGLGAAIGSLSPRAGVHPSPVSRCVRLFSLSRPLCARPFPP